MTETTIDGDGFGPENLPYGVDTRGHVVVAYGDKAIDLAALARIDQERRVPKAPELDPEVFLTGSLNAFMALGPPSWEAVRGWLRARLDDLPEEVLEERDDLSLRLPFEVSDYVDFYSCEAHVRNLGRILRPDEDPLPPAWRYLPIGYHGRSSTVVTSGEVVWRPAGIVGGESGPEYRATRRLDVEVELGFVVGIGTARGRPVPASSAEEHVFGVVLVNDWSARDVQAFEYRPLGPFLGKSFATSVSPWVVPLAALSPWKVAGPAQQPEPASYLRVDEPRGFGINLELELNGSVISAPDASELYWSMAQQFAHLTVNGACLRTGELFATGTVSGSAPHTAGSLIELTRDGCAPILLEDGTTRAWLEDGDEVTIRGWCGDRGERGWISLGEVRGRVIGADAPVDGVRAGHREAVGS